MQTTLEASQISQKTRELCQAILDEPNMLSIRQRIDTFMTNDQARSQYDKLMAKGQELQQKQQSAMPLSGEEIDQFEKQREALLNNPVARGYIDAQEEMHEVQESIFKQVGKTIELGRIPTEEDLGGGCGHGCGCHH